MLVFNTDCAEHEFGLLICAAASEESHQSDEAARPHQHIRDDVVIIHIVAVTDGDVMISSRVETQPQRHTKNCHAGQLLI